MQKKILSMVLMLLIAVTMMPTAAFADEATENGIWIPIMYSGDVSVTVKSDISHNNDAKRGLLEVYQEGKITFDVEGKNGLALQTVTVMSGVCDGSLDNALDQVTYSDNEGTFKADENGKITVTLNAKTDRAYYIQGTFDFNDENTENSIWIPIMYSGDVSVTVKSDISHNNDANRGFLEVYQEGKITFDVEGKNGLALQTVTVMSGVCDGSLDNALDQVTFSDNEGTFKADENGKVTVTLNVKTDRAYDIQETFDFNDENSVWIPIKYSEDVSVNIKFNGNYDSDTDRCIAEFYEEGKASLDVAHKWNDGTLKAVVVCSGLITESLDSVSYDTCDGIFHMNSKECVKITLNLKKDRAYTISEIYEGRQDFKEIQKDISKISAAVATSKTAKGIKVKLSTKSSISDIKDFGYKVEYKIYRATSKNGKYTLKKTTTAKTYTDKSVKKGKKYYYKVRMYVKDSNGKVIKSTKLSQSNVSSKLYK